MKIKLLKQYGINLPGIVIDPEKNVADELIKRGIAEVYIEDAEVKALVDEIRPLASKVVELKKLKGKKK